MSAQMLQWVGDFLRDGQNGNNSSSRLISVGAATIMGIYLLADIVSRWLAGAGMNESVMLACVAGLVTLGTGTYAVNKWAGVKRAEGGPDAPEQGVP